MSRMPLRDDVLERSDGSHRRRGPVGIVVRAVQDPRARSWRRWSARPTAVDLVKVDVDANPRLGGHLPGAVHTCRVRHPGPQGGGQLHRRLARARRTPVGRLPDAGADRSRSADRGRRRGLAAPGPGARARPTSGPCWLWPPFWSTGRRRSPTQEALSLLARMPETAETRHLAAQARLGGETGGEQLSATTGWRPSSMPCSSGCATTSDARQEFVDLLEVLGPDDPRTASLPQGPHGPPVLRPRPAGRRRGSVATVLLAGRPATT